MTISVKAAGDFGGRRVDEFKLVSNTGVEVDILSYGVVVRDWRVPLKSGELRSVALGFPTFAPYPEHSPHFGSLAGRVANRIAGGTFELDGATYNTPKNFRGRHTLHGGPEGLGLVVWDAAPDSATNSITFSHFSPDGHMGFPGNVQFRAVYTLTGNRLRLDLSATTDRQTPINVVQHQYFNLGTGSDILDHTYQVTGDRYTELGEDLIPTGRILSVEGTQWDMRKPRNMRDAAGQPVAYDGNVALPEDRNFADPVATVTGPDGELTLKLWTDRPGLQVYNGMWTDVHPPGGPDFGSFAGFCLEDQDFPDALHNPNFPSIIYGPENPYSHWCEIEIV
ncbi:MAG TPA: aldose epimerase family protein [Devosia sp.]|nr:aldose epimerase family protein [Devosia sp.]